MSTCMFGLGSGWLNSRADRIARRHGARLVNHVDPGCSCGYGCDGYRSCPANMRHWFECPNRGEPFDGAVARAVMADIERAGGLAALRSRSDPWRRKRDAVGEEA